MTLPTSVHAENKQFKDFLRQDVAAFPDHTQTFTPVIAEGDMVATWSSASPSPSAIGYSVIFSKSRSAASMKELSAGFPPSPVACPQIDGIGRSSAFGICATSSSLSRTRK